MEIVEVKYIFYLNYNEDKCGNLMLHLGKATFFS